MSKLTDEICEFHGLEIFYGDDGTVGRHVYDGDSFDTASKPGWYYSATEADGGAFAADMQGPFATRYQALTALVNDLVVL